MVRFLSAWKLAPKDVILSRLVNQASADPEDCELKPVPISPPRTLKASSGSESESPKRRGQRQLKKQ